MLKAENNPSHTSTPSDEILRNPTSDPIHFIFFKSERMYSHHTIRFNYTTYDVRRSQDVINPRTAHCNIMMLNKPARNPDSGMPTESESCSSAHPFLYAQVIGIYHVNVIYTGPGMLNYNATRFNFLWVRWYEHVPNTKPYRLDQLTFPPMAGDDAFGFVDPADVLRSCHIIPAFEQGAREGAGAGMSEIAHDRDDYRAYYVGRYVMLFVSS